MHLTDLEVTPGRVAQGGPSPVSVSVEVTEDGVFKASFQGEEFEAEYLDRLRLLLREALLASRFEVPFAALSGRRGVMRGYHAGTRDLLVTWDDGEKDRIDNYAPVFAEIDVETLDRLRTLRRRKTEIDAEIREITDTAVKASDVFNAMFGADITDHRRTNAEARATL